MDSMGINVMMQSICILILAMDFVMNSLDSTKVIYGIEVECSILSSILVNDVYESDSKSKFDRRYRVTERGCSTRVYEVQHDSCYMSFTIVYTIDSIL